MAPPAGARRPYTRTTGDKRGTWPSRSHTSAQGGQVAARVADTVLYIGALSQSPMGDGESGSPQPLCWCALPFSLFFSARLTVSRALCPSALTVIASSSHCALHPLPCSPRQHASIQCTIRSSAILSVYKPYSDPGCDRKRSRHVTLPWLERWS